MNEVKKLEEAFQNWKVGKDSKLLILYKKRLDLEKTEKDFNQIDEKIKQIELEINQRKSKLERDLLKLYKKMDLGNSKVAKDARRERTHKLCQLGELIEKSGMGDLTREVLFGMLIQQKEYLEGNSNILKKWEERGLKELQE